MKRRTSSLVAPGLALALLLGSAVALEKGASARRVWLLHGSPLSRGLPKGIGSSALLAALSGQERSAADAAYIQALQYVGNKWNYADSHWGKALRLYREVLWLDPSFRHAGREGIAVLGWLLNRPEEAKLLIRDLRHWDPGEPRYAIYLAALGYKEKLDPAGVIEALRPELARPDAPEMLLRMAGNVYLKAKDWSGAQAYWRWLQHRSKDPITLRQAQRALGQAADGLRREREREEAAHGRR